MSILNEILLRDLDVTDLSKFSLSSVIEHNNKLNNKLYFKINKKKSRSRNAILLCLFIFLFVSIMYFVLKNILKIKIFN